MNYNLKEIAEEANKQLQQINAIIGGTCDEKVSVESIQYYLKNVVSLVEYEGSGCDDCTNNFIYVAEITNNFKSRIAEVSKTAPKDIDVIMFDLFTYASGSIPYVRIAIKCYGKDSFIDIALKDSRSLALALTYDLESICHQGEPSCAIGLAYEEIFSQYYGRDPWKYEKKEVAEANSLLRKNGILATIDIEDVQYYLENILTTRDRLVKDMPFYRKTQCIAEVSSLLKTDLAKTLSIPRESIITIHIVTETDKWAQ